MNEEDDDIIDTGPSTPPETVSSSFTVSSLSEGVRNCTNSLSEIDEMLPDELTPKPLQSVFLASSRLSGINNHAFTPHDSKHGNLAELGGVVHVDIADLNEKGITELNINQKSKGDFINCCGKKIPKKSGRFILAAIGSLIAFSIFIGRAVDRKMSFGDIVSEILTIIIALITPSFLEGWLR